ncbi:MAG: glycosyltransferase [Saprospiraceae bacterium]
MVHFHATDQQEEKDIRIQLGVREKQITLVPNLPQMKQGPFTEIVKKKNQIKIIFLARIHPIKNLHLLLQVLSNIQSKYSIHLNIYGVIEDSQYWEQKCLPVINTLPDNISVSSPKEIPHDKVHNLMTQNHLFALLTSGENFGHSIFESFLAGRPVLISDQTPWTNLEEKGIGLSLPLNNIDAFTQAIETFAVMDQEAFDLYAKRAWQFADEYVNDPELVQGYQKMFS